jgi:hypothetical protein
MSLVKLPYELVSYVVHYLELTDVFSLSLTCKKFLFLFQEANISKLLLEVSSNSSRAKRECGSGYLFADGSHRPKHRTPKRLTMLESTRGMHPA